jgi:hypothetical protein
MLGSYCRGRPRGSPKKPRESCLKLAKNTKRKHSSNITQNIRTQHSPCCDGPRGPPEQPSRRPLEQVRLARGLTHPSGEVRLARGLTPPSGEVHLARGLTPPSGGFRLARGSPPPSSGFCLAWGPLTSAPAPARGYEHLMLWHSRAAPPRAWESCPGAIPPTP